MAMIIPEQHYVGYRDQGQNRLPLGFATPYEDTAAGRKRQATVDSWSGIKRANPTQNAPVIVDNVLMEGFKLSEEVRRHSGWGNGNVVWRIEDPRGFELEISSPNFASIIECTTIVNGEIQGRCVWGREGGSNVLLPEASTPYQEAHRLTKLSKQKVSIKDIAVGDKVRLKDGRDVLFLGTYNILAVDSGYKYVSGHSYSSGNYQYTLAIGSVKKRHLFVDAKHVGSKTVLSDLFEVTQRPHYTYPTFYSHVEAASDFKASEIVERRFMAIETSEVCKFINELPGIKRCNLLGSDYSLIAISAGKFGEIRHEFVPQAANADEIGRCVFAIVGGEPIMIKYQHRSRYSDAKNPDSYLKVKAALADLGKAVDVGSTTSFNFQSEPWARLELILHTEQGPFKADSISA